MVGPVVQQIGQLGLSLLVEGNAPVRIVPVSAPIYYAGLAVDGGVILGLVLGYCDVTGLCIRYEYAGSAFIPLYYLRLVFSVDDRGVDELAGHGKYLVVIKRLTLADVYRRGIGVKVYIDAALQEAHLKIE